MPRFLYIYILMSSLRRLVALNRTGIPCKKETRSVDGTAPYSEDTIRDCKRPLGLLRASGRRRRRQEGWLDGHGLSLLQERGRSRLLSSECADNP